MPNELRRNSQEMPNQLRQEAKVEKAAEKTVAEAPKQLLLNLRAMFKAEREARAKAEAEKRAKVAVKSATIKDAFNRLIMTDRECPN